MTGLRRPESVLVVIYTDDLDILLLKRRAPFPFWQSVTGSLDPGESPPDAALRELAEETGLRDEGQLRDTGRSRTFTIDPRWRHKYPDGVTENLEYEWHYRLPAALDIVSDPEEHSEWRWVPVSEAIERVWSWTNREALEQLCDGRAPGISWPHGSVNKRDD